jgi:transcriptional regulator with XRE-family HTH domain
MKYSDLLTSYIEKSGLSLGELSSKLSEKGISADRSYISKLKNGAKPPASEELSKALAKITGGDPDRLIWLAYVEKAPTEIKETLSIVDEDLLKKFKEVLKHFPDITEEDEFPGIRYFEDITKKEPIDESKFLAYKDFLISLRDSSKRGNNTLEDLNEPIYRQILNLAKSAFELHHGKSPNYINGQLIQAYVAFELRVNEILNIAYPQTQGNIAYLDNLSIKQKIEILSGFKINLEKGEFYEELNLAINIVNSIKYGVPEKVKYDDALTYLNIFEDAINFIDQQINKIGGIQKLLF